VGNFCSVVHFIAVGVGIERKRIIGIHFVPVAQAIPIGVRIRRVSSHAHFTPIVQTVVVTIGIIRVGMIGIHLLTVAQAVIIAVTVIRIGLVRVDFGKVA